MKKLLFGLMLFSLAGCSTYNSQTANYACPVTADQVKNDLDGKPVQVGAQTWWFSTNQNVVVKDILEKKWTYTGDQIAVSFIVDATVNVEDNGNEVSDPQQRLVEPIKKPKKSMTVQINGIGKAYYEKIANNWYLINVDSVTLKITSKE